MRRFQFATAFAALLIAACSQESTEPTRAIEAELWQGELPIRQPWLRDRLPDQSLVYLRIPNLLGLLATPKGSVLDPALRSTANVENVERIRQGLIDNVLGEIPAVTEAKLHLFNEYIRSPIEVSGIFVPAPTSLIAVTLDIDSNEAFDALLDEVGFTLAAPLDADNAGRIDGAGMPLFVQFDAATGRLLLQTGPGANETAFQKALAGMDRSEPHRMRAMEQRIDESGQGFFLWVDANEAMPMMQMFMPRPQLQKLIDLGIEKVSALALGWGVANGKGRISLIADVPSEDDRGFIPYVRNELSATSVGDPDGILLLSVPTVEEFSRLEALALEVMPPGDASDWHEGKALVEETIGVPLEDLFASLGPEIFVIFDQAGDYLAIRLRDADLFDSVIARIEATTGSAPEQREVGGETYYHWSLPNEAALADTGTMPPDTSLFVSLWARQRDHLYWVREDDFLYVASIPQVLMDRAAMRPRTAIGRWLAETQHIEASEAVLSISGTSRKLPKRLYSFYVEVLQFLSDVSLADIDVWSMPTAAQLGLPERGTMGFTVNLGNPTVGFELTFENNPAEMLGGVSTVAIVGIVAAIAIPAYADYSTRAQVAEGLNLASGLKAAVTEYYVENGRFPGAAEAAQLSMPQAAARYVESVTVQAGNGWIVIDYRGEVAETGGQVILVPNVAAGGSIDWSCSGTFLNKHLPTVCRDQETA